MDNLALSVTKSITDFLENNEKRFANQNSELERQNKLLADLQAKYEKLEKKFGELENENTNLKSEIQSLKQADDAASNDMMTFKSDLHKMQDQAKKYGDWVNVMGVLTQQVHDLNLIRDDTKRRMDEFFSKQSKLEKIIVKQQREINSVSATARAASASAAAAAAAPSPITNAPHYSVINRTPVRSPSTSSFFNGNNNSHHQMHRFKPQMSNSNHNHFSHYTNDDYLGSSDPFDEVSELSENAEELLKGVQALNELQRSFEKGSICSD